MARTLGAPPSPPGARPQRSAVFRPCLSDQLPAVLPSLSEPGWPGVHFLPLGLTLSSWAGVLPTPRHPGPGRGGSRTTPPRGALPTAEQEGRVGQEGKGLPVRLATPHRPVALSPLFCSRWRLSGSGHWPSCKPGLRGLHLLRSSGGHHRSGIRPFGPIKSIDMSWDSVTMKHKVSGSVCYLASRPLHSPGLTAHFYVQGFARGV